MDNKTKIAGSLLTIALLISLGINVLPSDNYYCEAREMTYHCDSLSKYYQLENGKCINDIMPNKLCRSGWVKIGIEDIREDISQKMNAKEWLCSVNGCVAIE